MRKTDTLLLLVFFLIYIAFDRYSAYDVEGRISDDIQYLAKTTLNTNLDVANVNSRIDSLHLQNQALAETVLYLDSCNQGKTQKADRAERRGKFVGGLIKGLFPGI